MQRQNANALRMLAVDAVEKAQSGHPGAPMGMADIAEVLWNEFVRHDPMNPTLPNRDRVIFSNGHASMLLYGALHLLGYPHITIDALKNFRQLHSCTTGHPEYDIANGIEMTTGPLGQGLASAVGMAIGERVCAEQYNKEGIPLFDNYTYVFVGDGCLMEGISHEACSFAGTLGLGKLIVLYDSNGISIDGAIQPWFADNTPERFAGYHWHVIAGIDGHNPEAIRKAIEEARSVQDKPSLLCFTTTIGFGSPNKAGTSAVHGAPLGAEEVQAVRKELGWEYPPFIIPEEIYKSWNALEKGNAHTQAWEALYAKYTAQYPKEAQEYSTRHEAIFSKAFCSAVAQCKERYAKEVTAKATRIASKEIVSELLPTLPNMIGGSADLTPSVGTWTPHSRAITKKMFAGNYISYGVREFGMGAVMNGLALYENSIPYGGTFLVFADYAKPALRLGAMMNIRTIWILTHDSIGVGEDGPTHQPIEHLTMLRTTPNVHVWRPCDALETVYSWEFAIQHTTGPVALILSRQNLPAMKRTQECASNIARGGYILAGVENPAVILLATGSEVSLAMEAHAELTARGIASRVVSMPSTTVFELQEEGYRASIIPKNIPVVAIEAGEKHFWYKYVGTTGAIVGLDGYGLSGKGAEIFMHFGITTQHVVDTATALSTRKHS